MKIKKSFLYFGMAIVLLSFIGNYIVYITSQLKEPIMMKHYYHISANRGTNIDLHYIANRSNDIDIQWITIPGIEYEFISPRYDMPHSGQSNNHYQMKTFPINIDDRVMDLFNGKPFTFDQVIAHLSNGKSVTMPIGEITIFTPESPTLNVSSSGSSSDNSGFKMIKSEFDAEITGLDVPFAEDLKSALSLKLHKTELDLQKFIKGSSSDLFPISVKKDELFPIHHEFSFAENDPLKFNYYLIDVFLHGKDQNGRDFTDTFFLSYRPYFEPRELRMLVKEVEK